MKKLACLLLCALLLCGCTGEPVPTEPTETPTRPVVEVPMEEETAPLRYEGVQLNYWSLLAQDDAEARVLQLAAADFEETTGAEVQLNWLAGDEARLAQLLAEKGQVDLFEVSGEGLKQNHLNDALDLTELARNAGYEEKSWDTLRSQILDRCGTLRAVAHRPCLYGFYYNRESFEAVAGGAVPSGWQDYLAFCQQAQEAGFEPLVIDQERAHLILELHMERALGWDTLRDTMVNSLWRQNDMGMTMIQEAIGFAEAGYLVKGNPAVYPLGQNRLAQSNVIFVAGSNVLCAEVEESTLSEISWGVCPYPGDGPGSGLLVDADVLAIQKDCAQPEAAFEFILLLTTGEYDQLRADLTLGIPADPANSSPIAGANSCMAEATAHAPKWFTPEHNELFTRLWNGYYKTGAYFANQLNQLARYFADEKTVG